MSGSEKATFRAAFPATQTAIQRHGAGNGMRFVLDVPESDLPEAVKMLAWTQRVLVVTVEPESDGERDARKPKL